MDENTVIFVQIHTKRPTFGRKCFADSTQVHIFAPYKMIEDMDIADKLIGRQRECEELKWAVDSRRSELVVMYGRRRIGKTFLVRRFFNDMYSFHYVGAHKQAKAVQLQNFREALIRYSQDKNLPPLSNWHDAFLQLERYLESCKEKRKVLFFDEMPWMDTQGSDFVAELEYFWANWVQDRDDIVFIACGSVLFLGKTDRTVKAVCKLKPVFAADIYPFVLCVKLYMPVFFETHIVIDKSLGVAVIRTWVGYKKPAALFQHSAYLADAAVDIRKVVKRIPCNNKVKSFIFKRKVNAAVAYELEIAYAVCGGTFTVCGKCFADDIESDHRAGRIFSCYRESQIAAACAEVEYPHSLFDIDKAQYRLQMLAVLRLPVVEIALCKAFLKTFAGIVDACADCFIVFELHRQLAPQLFS